MKKIQTLLPYFIIIGLLCWIFLLMECSTKCPEVTSDTLVVTKVDTITNTKYYTKVKPIYVVDSVYKWHSVDTAEILKECQSMANEYTSRAIYYRIIQMDTLGTFSITDTVCKNELNGYVAKWDLKTYTKTLYIDKYIVPKNKMSVLVGGHIGYNKQSMSITPCVMLKTTKNHYYYVGFEPFTRTYNAGAYFKIY